MGKPRNRAATSTQHGGKVATNGTPTRDQHPGKSLWHRFGVPVAMASIFTVMIAMAIQSGWKSRGLTLPFMTADTSSDLPCGFRISRNVVPVKAVKPGEAFATATVARGIPVVLQQSSVTQWKAQTWTLDYIRRKAGKTLTGVYENSNRWFGPYFDKSKPLLPYTRRPNTYSTNLTLPMDTFMERLGRRRADSDVSNWIYYTGPLEDLGSWTLDDVDPISELLLPNPAVSSVNIWMGPPNVIAHCHYDGYHNFYAQLIGRKRFWLVRPRAWPHLKSAPFLHPMHAQCQVNLSTAADSACEHRTDDIEVFEVILHPGDLLYIPPLWFHHVESVDTSVSVNVWTDSAQSDVALAMFEQKVPGSSLMDGMTTQQTAVLAISTVHMLLRRVCASGSCSTTVVNQKPLSGKLAAQHYLLAILNSRYQPMLDSGLLRLPQADWSRPACGRERNANDTIRELLGSEYDSYERDVTEFSRAVAKAVQELPAETRSVWLGNYVEFVIAHHVQAQFVAHLLTDALECIQ